MPDQKKEREGRDVLITGGGDWYDASADVGWLKKNCGATDSDVEVFDD